LISGWFLDADEHKRGTWKKILTVLEEKVGRRIANTNYNIYRSARVLLPQVIAEQSFLGLAGEPVRLQIFGIVFKVGYLC
jgi:hypothetical protein